MHKGYYAVQPMLNKLNLQKIVFPSNFETFGLYPAWPDRTSQQVQPPTTAACPTLGILEQDA